MVTHVPLGHISKFVRGVTYKPADLIDNFSENSIVCMRTANIQEELDENDLKSIKSSVVKSNDKYLLEGDILVSTANSWNLVGKCCWVKKLNYPAVPGGFIAALRVDKSKADPRYVYHWFNSKKTQELARNCGRQTTNISNMDLNRCLSLELPLPSLAEQRRIAAILDKAEALRAKRREAIAKLDQLLQSMFLAMFGDPVKNSMGWSSSTLDVHGELKNGINFLKDEVGVKLRYLGVGDFKNRTTFKDIDNLSYISLNYNPSEDYLLKDHDILFVRSNGNKQLVGRCMAIFPGNEKITFSGFCIRFRCKSQLLLSSYLVHLFKNSAFKQELLKSGQGANIQNINQKILSTIKIPVPPITQQVKWQEFVEKVESQKYLFEKNISLAEKLISALHKKFFN